MMRVEVGGVGLRFAGHWMQLEKPDVVNQLLLDFLAWVGTPARV